MKSFLWEELNRFPFFDDFSKILVCLNPQNSLSKTTQNCKEKDFWRTIEKAIASSQIEGAVITRKQGKGTSQNETSSKPIQKKMVTNNYETIVHIETRMET